MDEKGGRGYPHIALLDASGSLLAVHRGSRTVPDFAKSITVARKVSELRPKAEGGDRAARIDLLRLLLDTNAVELLEAERLLGQIGDPGEDPPRMAAGVARLRLSERSNDLIPARIQRDAELILSIWPDDLQALWHAANSGTTLKDHRKALLHLLEAQRRFPDKYYFYGMLTEFFANKGFIPVAFDHLYRGLKLPERGGAAYVAASEKRIQAYQPSGGDLWEPTPVSTPIPGCETIVYKPAGKSRDPKLAWDEHIAVCTKDGVPQHAIRHYNTLKGVTQLWLAGYDGMELLRETKTSWTLQEVEQMVAAAHAAIPKTLEASRFKKLMIWPLALTAATEGLQLDPDNLGLKRALAAFTTTGWDAVEREVEKDLGEGRRVTVYRPAGKTGTAKPWADERVAIVAGPDGAFVRAYVPQSGPPGPKIPRYVSLRDDQGTMYVRRAAEPVTAEALAAVAAAVEPSLAPHRKGQEALAQARKHDAVGRDAEEAVALLRQALKTDPQNLQVASDLVDCYLAISDRTRDAAKSDELYPKALGAVTYLSRLDPDYPTIALAAGIYAYRFLNYPQAIQWLVQAGGDRAQEILGILRDTGQAEYRKWASWDLDGLQVDTYERVRRPDAVEKSLEGLQLVERCFVGGKDGMYRFTAVYRVQMIAGAAQRELLLNRFERSYQVRTFEAEPAWEELVAEVMKAVRSLKTGK